MIGKYKVFMYLTLLLVLASSCSDNDSSTVDSSAVDSSAVVRGTEEEADEEVDDGVEDLNEVSVEADGDAGAGISLAPAVPIQPREIHLNIFDEPLNVHPLGFIRFSGSIGGRVGLLDLAGKGLLVRRGDRVGDYYVISISGRSLVLSGTAETNVL